MSIQSKAAIAWWEARRLQYNAGLIVACVAAYLCYLAVWFIALPRDLALAQLGLTGSRLFFQAVDFVVVIAVANICYFFGPMSEQFVQPQNAHRYREVTYRLGLWFSCLLPFCIPVLVALGLSGRPGDGALSKLEKQGDEVIAKIYDYRGTHGDFPSDLAAAGIHVPTMPYGGWKYTLSPDRSWFTLSIGDYGKHQFTLSYASKRKMWHRDT